MSKKLVIVKLGSKENGFIPGPKMFKEMEVAIQKAIDGDQLTSFLVTHPFVSLVTLDIDGVSKVVTKEKAEEEAIAAIPSEETNKLREDTNSILRKAKINRWINRGLEAIFITMCFVAAIVISHIWMPH